MTTHEAAERLGANVRVVQRWIQQGRLSAQKIGRDWHITEEAVAAFQKKPSRWDNKPDHESPDSDTLTT